MMLDSGSDISCRGEGTVWHDDMHNAKHMDCVFRTEVAETFQAPGAFNQN